MEILHWQPLGGILTSNIAAVSWGPNRIDIFARGTDKQLYHKIYDNGSWIDWVPIGGVLADNCDPVAVSWGAGRLDIIAKMTDNNFYHRFTSDGVTWSTAWKRIGVTTDQFPPAILGNVCAVTWFNQITVIGRVQNFSDGRCILVSTTCVDGQNWSPWDMTVGNSQNNSVQIKNTDLIATSMGAPRGDIFVKDLNGGVGWFETNLVFPPATSFYRTTIGKPLGNDLSEAYSTSAISWGPNRLDIFSVDVNGGYYHNYSDDGLNWGGWESLHGLVTSEPSVVSRGANLLDVFVRGGDKAVYNRSWNGHSWLRSEKLGGTISGKIAVTSWDVNRIDIFVIGENDNQMWHKYWNGFAWLPSSDVRHRVLS